MRRWILITLATALLPAAPAWAQRDRAAFGEGFTAKVVRMVEEHPLESAGAAAAAAVCGALARAALTGRKKEEEPHG